MENDPGKVLVQRVSLLAAALCAVGAGPAWLIGGGPALWGYLGGVGIGLLSLGGILVTVSVAVGPRGEERAAARRRRVTLALYLLKYLVVIAGLYLLVAHYEVNEWAILCGLLIPILLLILLGMRLRARRGRPPRP